MSMLGEIVIYTWQAQLLKMTVHFGNVPGHKPDSYFWEVRSWGFSGAAANIYLLKVNNTNTKKRCKIRHGRYSDAFIVNFEHSSHLFLVFLLLTLNK